MYEVRKDKGNNQIISLCNTETNAKLNLDRDITNEVMDILEEEGYTFEGYSSEIKDPAKVLKLKDEWAITIGEDTKNKLNRLAMPITKPIRNQQQMKHDNVNKEESKEPVDIFDLIYGSIDD